MSETPPSEVAARRRVADDVAALRSVPFLDSFGDEVYFPSRAEYVDVATALRSAATQEELYRALVGSDAPARG